MKRRDFLVAGLGTGMVLGLNVMPKLVRADDRPFTFTSWGGALSAAEKSAFMDPFGAAKGISIINTSPTETAKIKAMVQAGAVEWDLVDVGDCEGFADRVMSILEDRTAAVLRQKDAQYRRVTDSDLAGGRTDG